MRSRPFGLRIRRALLWSACGFNRRPYTAAVHDFRYVGNRLFCEGVAVETLARRFGTPLYVYSQRTLTDHFQEARPRHGAGRSPRLLCGQVQFQPVGAADARPARQRIRHRQRRRIAARRSRPAAIRSKCVFAGVGKTEAEIEFALKQGVYSFNAESEPELERINRVAARLRKIAPVAVRVNPDVEAHTHAKITTGTYENKFGIAFEQIEGVYARASRLKNLRLRGLQMHIGSQITDAGTVRAGGAQGAAARPAAEGPHGLEFFSIGGGLGIVYQPALASGSARWWKSAAGRRNSHAADLRGAPRAAAPAARPADPDGAGPVHLRQRRHPRDPRRIRETHGHEETLSSWTPR